LNYLSDIIDGGDSYADRMNADLYERTTERFGVCAIPGKLTKFHFLSLGDELLTESLRIELNMESYNDNSARRFKLNINNDWLRCRQGVALPILLPTTPEARKYFFSTIGKFVADASTKGNRKINYVDFAKAWNQTADGKTRCYVTSDVLAAYAKTWDKTNNARASQELIEANFLVTQTRELFQAHTAPFPDSLIGFASSSHPQRGVIDFTDSDDHALPSSITVDLAISHPRIMPNPPAEGHGPYAQRNRQPKEPCSSSASAVAQNSCEAVRTRGSTKVDSGDPYISPAGSGQIQE
jgi:hypothetical protein